MAVSFTAISGYIIYTSGIDFQLVYLAMGVFILAGGASAFNEFQEWKYDIKMRRTMYRPIPAGKISPLNSAIIAAICVVAGSTILFYYFGLITFMLGLFNIVWYNLLYTYLKRITPFAVVPGALTGAVPAFMGWTAGGGFVFESGIVFIGFFLFIWQIPHFWLLMLKYGKEYEAAGFPTINQSTSPANLNRIIYAWVVATSVASIMIPFFIVNISFPFFIIIFLMNLFFVTIFTKLSFGRSELNLKHLFISINVYMFVFMLLLAVYHLVGWN